MPSPFCARRPFRFARRRFDHGARALVREVAQPKLDGVRSGGVRELVHERLDREHVRVRAERSQRRDAQRHRRHGMVRDALDREFIERQRIALASAACRHRHVGRRRRLVSLIEVPCREQAGARVPAGPPDMAAAPEIVPPVDDAASGVERSAHLYHHARSERLPREFVVAHPLHAYRRTVHGAREDDGIERGIVGAVVPIATGTVCVPHHDVARRDLQYLRELVAQRINGLAMRPHFEPAALPARDRARGADRSVREIRAAVGCGERLRRGRYRRRLLAQQFLLGRRGQQELGQRIDFREVRLLAPLCAASQGARRPDRLLFALRDDTEEAAFANDRAHAGLGTRGSEVN